MDETEIQARYHRREFPIDVSSAKGMDKIISRCWTSAYVNAGEILEDLTFVQT